VTRWLTVEQVAENWSCSTETVRRAIRRGDLPALRYGALWRISQDALTAFESKHTRKTA
jgi:excisionase family DNA binding protein